MGTTFTAQQTSETPRGHISQGLRPRLESSLAHLKQAALSVRAETKQREQWSVRKRELLSIWFEEIVHMSSDRAAEVLTPMRCFATSKNGS